MLDSFSLSAVLNEIMEYIKDLFDLTVDESSQSIFAALWEGLRMLIQGIVNADI